MKVLKLETVYEVIRLAEAAPASDGLKAYLRAIPNDQMAELVALMWLGRSDFHEGIAEYPELIEHAKRTIDSAAEYVAGKGPLAKYLRAGLDTLTGIRRFSEVERDEYGEDEYGEDEDREREREEREREYRESEQDG